MGQTGYVAFYTDVKPADPCAALQAALRLTNGNLITYAFRTLRPDTEWRLFKEQLRQPRFRPSAVTRVKSPAIEQVADLLPLELGSSLFKEDVKLALKVGGCPLASRVIHALSAIPETVRDRFIPVDVYIWIGWHDLFECAEQPEGHYFGRPFFTVKFGGHGTPRDWKEYRRQALSNPEVVMIKSEFEQIFGPMQQCIYWSI